MHLLARVLAVACVLLLSAQLTILDARLRPATPASPVGGAALPPQPETVRPPTPAVPGDPTVAPTPAAAPTAPPAGTPESAATSDRPGTSVAARDDGQAEDEAAAPATATRASGTDRPVSTTMAAASSRHDPARARFERRYPAHAGAGRDPGRPATTRWAVLIGINEHAGTTRDNVASRQDAEALAAHLHQLGWLDDHVLVLTDHAATGETIQQALAWLARKAQQGDLAVVHYSGHVKQRSGDPDGDGEQLDELLWPSDNDFVSDRTFTRLLRAVPATLWVNIAACEAAGVIDAGLAGPGRLLTFSSREVEKSYEDPEAGNSVWGRFLIAEGMQAAAADNDGNGDVTVEEAAAYAAPRAEAYTSRQRFGPQRPVIVDGDGSSLSLRIPGTDSGDERSDSEPDAPGCGLPVCIDDRERR